MLRLLGLRAMMPLGRLTVTPRTSVTVPLTLMSAQRAYGTPSVAKKEWPLTTFLKEKTGQTGGFMFGAGIISFLISKEYIIFHDETVVCIGMGGVIYALYSKLGGKIGETLDAEIDKFMKDVQYNHDSVVNRVRKTRDDLAKDLNLLDDVGDFMSARLSIPVQQEEVRVREKRLQLYDAAIATLNQQVASFDRLRSDEHAAIVAFIADAISKQYTADKVADSVNECIEELKLVA